MKKKTIKKKQWSNGQQTQASTQDWVTQPIALSQSSALASKQKNSHIKRYQVHEWKYYYQKEQIKIVWGGRKE